MTIMFLVSCETEKKKEEIKEVITSTFVPKFNADSSYSYIEKQLSFGPRVPNTKPHNLTGDYIISQFKNFGWEVEEQNFESTTFDEQRLYLRNIIGSFHPERKKRVLLAAHWDTRPYADKDIERKNEPIAGANDGASGVAVLLEIARVTSKFDSLNIGLDIIFFDGEDWGEGPDQYTQPTNGLESWWCLGSQYWSKNKHKANYSAYYGILLDMVGGNGSQFYIEDYSQAFAPSIVNKVWNKGIELGYGRYFIKQTGGSITDDHYFVNRYAKIPMIDIIPSNPIDGSFGDFHHTHQDDLPIISKETLKAVGQTLLAVIYNE